MQTVLKIYSKQTDSVPIAQILDILDLTISEDINGISSAEITTEANIPNIAQYRKIEVYEIKNGTDNLLFLGYIDSFRPSIDKIVLNCKSEKSLLSRKLILSDHTFTNQTIGVVFTTLFNEWNTAYGDDWSILTSIATTVSKTIKTGDNFYDTIEEIAKEMGAVWNSYDRVIKIETLLGTDYTIPSNFKELVYNGSYPRENNISSVEYESYGTLSNVIIGDDGTTKNTQSDSTSITNYGPLAEYVQFRPGALNTSVSNYLLSKKGGQFSYKIGVDPFGFEANCGDKVQMRIENVSQYFNYSGSVIIQTKKTKIVNATKICEYEVSDKYVYFDSFVNRFLEVESNLNLKLLR